MVIIAATQTAYGRAQRTRKVLHIALSISLSSGALIFAVAQTWGQFQRPSTKAPVHFERPEAVSGIPIRAGSAVVLKQTIINRGTETARSIQWGMDIQLSDSPPTRETADREWTRFADRIRSNSELRRTGVDLAPGADLYMSIRGDTLSASDVEAIESGRRGLYVLGIALYGDAHGELQSELCAHLDPPGRQNVWRRCAVHNGVGRVSRFQRSSLWPPFALPSPSPPSLTFPYLLSRNR